MIAIATTREQHVTGQRNLRVEEYCERVHRTTVAVRTARLSTAQAACAFRAASDLLNAQLEQLDAFAAGALDA